MSEAVACESDSRRLAWWRQAAVRVLKCGHLPQHVAFIMDGNRRFARRNRFNSVLQGHQSGFEKLKDVLEWCLALGIPHVTVYAFSLDNFKRSKEEVDALLNLCEEKIDDLEQNFLMRHKINDRTHMQSKRHFATLEMNFNFPKWISLFSICIRWQAVAIISDVQFDFKIIEANACTMLHLFFVKNC